MFEEPKENRGLSGNPRALIVGKEPHWCRRELARSPGHTDKGSTEELSLPLQGGFLGSVRKQVPSCPVSGLAAQPWTPDVSIMA